ncbi:MAG: anti-sigma factor family protein [Kangiellaceae bacterium]
MHSSHNCNHQLVIEHIHDYIEGNLVAEMKRQVESMLDHCSECQSTHKQYLEMHQLSYQWQEQDVPDWHRTRYAVRPPIKQSFWLNWSAMATSTLAILMVVFQLELTTSERGLTVSFGGSQTEEKISKLVDEQLTNYKSTLDKSFDLKLNVALEKQNNLTKIRLADWLEKNRSERQQDINFVMTGWQSQRYEDQKQVDQQLSYIADNQIENNQAINQLFNSVNGQEKNNSSSRPNKL